MVSVHPTMSGTRICCGKSPVAAAAICARSSFSCCVLEGQARNKRLLPRPHDSDDGEVVQGAHVTGGGHVSAGGCVDAAVVSAIGAQLSHGSHVTTGGQLIAGTLEATGAQVTVGAVVGGDVVGAAGQLGHSAHVAHGGQVSAAAVLAGGSVLAHGVQVTLGVGVVVGGDVVGVSTNSAVASATRRSQLNAGPGSILPLLTWKCPTCA